MSYNQNAIRYIRSLPKEKRIELLGEKGAEIFEKNPNSWKVYMKNYQPVEVKTGFVEKYLNEKN